METGSDHPPRGYAFLALRSLRPRPKSDQGARRRDHFPAPARPRGVRVGGGAGTGQGRGHSGPAGRGKWRECCTCRWAAHLGTSAHLAWSHGQWETPLQCKASRCPSLGQQTAVQDPASGIIEVPGSEDAALLAVDFHAGRRWCLRGRGRCEESPEGRILCQDAPGPRLSPGRLIELSGPLPTLRGLSCGRCACTSSSSVNRGGDSPRGARGGRARRAA